MIIPVITALHGRAMWLRHAAESPRARQRDDGHAAN